MNTRGLGVPDWQPLLTRKWHVQKSNFGISKQAEVMFKASTSPCIAKYPDVNKYDSTTYTVMHGHTLLGYGYYSN